MPDQEAQPEDRSGLSSFGEELRREREIRGISLKEIADATKVSKRFLEAIERNDHKTLPAPVFTRGFVREYARYLGLNADDIVNRYNYAAAGDQHVEKSEHLTRLTTPLPDPHVRRPEPKKGIPPPYARIDRNIYLIVIITAALVAVSWWAIQHKREADAAREEVAAATTMEPARPVPVPAAAPPTPTDDVLRLTIDVTDDSWIELKVDDNKELALHDTLHKGDRRTFTAKDGFHFKTIGKASAVTLTLNETKLPPLTGDVRKDLTFDRDTLAELRSDEPRRE